MNRRRVGISGLLVGAAALAATAAGCGGGAANTDGGALFSCETEPRAVAYMPELTRASASGAWQAILVTSEPGPPVKGTNTWTMKVLDGAGAAHDDLTVTARTFMPDHNHGSTIRAQVTPMGGGVYRVTPLYLYMPGLWQVTLDLETASGAIDSVMFPICIPG